MQNSMPPATSSSNCRKLVSADAAKVRHQRHAGSPSAAVGAYAARREGTMVYLNLLNVSLEESFRDAEERFASSKRWRPCQVATHGRYSITRPSLSPSQMAFVHACGISMSMSMLICSVNT